MSYHNIIIINWYMQSYLVCWYFYYIMKGMKKQHEDNGMEYKS